MNPSSAGRNTSLGVDNLQASVESWITNLSLDRNLSCV